jgi:hypothetical protein
MAFTDRLKKNIGNFGSHCSVFASEFVAESSRLKMAVTMKNSPEYIVLSASRKAAEESKALSLANIERRNRELEEKESPSLIQADPTVSMETEIAQGLEDSLGVPSIEMEDLPVMALDTSEEVELPQHPSDIQEISDKVDRHAQAERYKVEVEAQMSAYEAFEESQGLLGKLKFNLPGNGKLALSGISAANDMLKKPADEINMNDVAIVLSKTKDHLEKAGVDVNALQEAVDTRRSELTGKEDLSPVQEEPATSVEEPVEELEETLGFIQPEDFAVMAMGTTEEREISQHPADIQEILNKVDRHAQETKGVSLEEMVTIERAKMQEAREKVGFEPINAQAEEPIVEMNSEALAVELETEIEEVTLEEAYKQKLTEQFDTVEVSEISGVYKIKVRQSIAEQKLLDDGYPELVEDPEMKPMEKVGIATEVVCEKTGIEMPVVPDEGLTPDNVQEFTNDFTATLSDDRNYAEVKMTMSIEGQGVKLDDRSL